MSKLASALRDPSAVLDLILALIRGHFYKIWLPFRGVRFSAGRNFRCFGTMKVFGPGQVIFGDNVTVGMHVTPFTHAKDAVLRVGNHCFLNGTRFGCALSIEIGDDCIIADSRIMDSNFHSTRADRWSADAPIRVKPVRIARNVWVAANAGILPGTTIGENSVVGFGAVCAGSYPANVLIAGNPASPVRAIDPSPTETTAERT